VLLFAYGLPIAAQALLIAVAGLGAGRVMPALEAWMDGQGMLQVGVVVLSTALLAYGFWRHSDPVSRMQLRWVSAGAVVAGLSGLLLWFGPELVVGDPLLPRSAVALLALPFPIALAAAISRHHLFELDIALNRSLVYGGLTAGVIATYAVTVALLRGFIPGDAPFAVALLGTGAVAVVALPLRDGLQRGVNRLMYGDRDDPDRALRRLGHRLEASLDPQTVLPTLVESVADALRSPYVAIELEADGESRLGAVHGAVPVDAGGPRELVRLPIAYHGREVGRLVLSPRGPGEQFGAADERLLADLARQAAPAVEEVRLTADLRRSREELVATREEERRRLRRDLHDELGPSLAGTLMKLGAARSLLDEDPARSKELLDDLQADTRGMIDEIRRIAHNLRPPALDELGLAGALRQHAATFDGGPPERPLRVAFEAPDDLPPLPAAVEVAALRIALEGLTNATRHSGASRARVSLTMDGDALVVTVTDDGSGMPDGAARGVGLTSMRERAEELGGSLDISSGAGGGTTVVARLPVAARQS
jgi:signal transduction histidine kinase